MSTGKKINQQSKDLALTALLPVGIALAVIGTSTHGSLHYSLQVVGIVFILISVATMRGRCTRTAAAQSLHENDPERRTD